MSLAEWKRWLAAGATAFLVMGALAFVVRPGGGLSEVSMITVTDLVTSQTSGVYFRGVEVASPPVTVPVVFEVGGVVAAPWGSTKISMIKEVPGEYLIFMSSTPGYTPLQLTAGLSPDWQYVTVGPDGSQVISVVFFLVPVTSNSSSP